MMWSDVPSRLGILYDSFAQWSFRNEVELDVITVAVVVAIIAIVLKEKRKTRRRLHRRFWGRLMKRKDRQQLQRMRFADAIVDAAMEMNANGDMCDHEEKAWYAYFADKVEMRDLLPKKKRNPKASILKRLSHPSLFGLLPVKIPGGKPEVKVDPTYDPNKEAGSLAKSKFLEG